MVVASITKRYLTSLATVTRADGEICIEGTAVCYTIEI